MDNYGEKPKFNNFGSENITEEHGFIQDKRAEEIRDRYIDMIAGARKKVMILQLIIFNILLMEKEVQKQFR